MKKIFLLISAFLLAATVSADPIGPNNSETTVTNALADAISAASANDVIELSDGIYKEAGAGALTISKNLTIQAATGAHPVIAQKCYFIIANDAQVTFRGIKFDGSIYTANDHCLRSHDASNGTETVTLEDCEFTHFPNYIIYTQKDSRRWDAITIRNCYFHNNTKSAVLITYSGDHQTCNSLTIENSTFADFTGNDYGVIYYGAPDGEHTTTLNVNHCTFYNNQLQAIQWKKSTNLTITNCIFAQPAAVEAKAVYCEGGAITNCLSYNTQGYSSAATPTGNLTGNPYFVNIESGSYDLTPASFSPAHNAGTDTKDMGDYLRWTSNDAAHVTTKNITAGTDAIKSAVEAAWPGDEIVLATGTYNESASIALNKNITIKAAAEATPTVVPINGFAISNGSEVTIQGLKFDATSITGNLISVSDATAGNELTLEGCELYNTGSYKAIYAAGSTHLDACVINNCYFHNGNNSAIHIDQGSSSHVCDRIEITNSTFANYSGFTKALIQIASKGGTLANDQEILVDHCTFYNFTKTADDTYGFIDSRKSANVTLSNCIFANPTAQASLPEGTYNPRASQLYGGTITNCLIYNVPNHRTESVTPANPIEANPLFTNAAGGDFTFPGNYVTDNVSPARKASTDGTDLGDPRWYTTATYPETDFAAPDYVFTAAKAKLSEGTTILETNESAPTHPYIRYTHDSPTGNAEWVIKATRACYVQATVNMADNTWTTDPSDAKMYQNHNHIFVVEVRDANGSLIGSVKECDYNEDGSTDGVDTYPTVNLPGYIYIPEAGVYTVKLRNPRNDSRCGVGSVTISYMGGDTQTITNTANFETDINDAWFTSCGTRAAGKISFSGDAVASEWVRWNVTVANSDYYDITINSAVTSGHIYSVTFYDGETQVARVAESAWHNNTGAINLGRRFLPAGNYVLEVQNSVSSNSDAQIVSVEAVAFVAPTIALANPLPAASAITSELAYEDGGEFYFTPSDKRGYILDQWAKWKVSVASAGLFLFTMNVTSSNEQSYVVTILDSENHELESFAKNPGSGDKTIKHYFNLAAGNYFVMVQNTTNHSAGHIVSFVVTEPDVVTIDENATSNSAWVDKIDENTYDVQIIRSFAGGMYNTFCLPFDVSSSQCKEVFGADVEIYTLGSATIEDNILNLDVDPASDIYPGTPVLIKPSHDIENPVFTDVEFTAATASSTPKTNANFVGSFVKTSLEASEDLLYVGPDNQVFFLSVDYDMPGMRAWFVIHDVPAALGSPKALRSARIIEREQTATSIQHVDQPNAAASKVLIDGQIIIIRGNEKFNIQGQNIQ